MTRPLTIIALAAAAALAGCNNDDHNIVVGPDVDDEPMNNVGVGASAVDPGQQGLSLQGQQPRLHRLAFGRHRAREEDTRGSGHAVAAGDASLKGDAKAASITYNGQIL